MIHTLSKHLCGINYFIIELNYIKNMKYLITIVCIILTGCSTKPTKGSSSESTNDSTKNVIKAPVVIDDNQTS